MLENINLASKKVFFASDIHLGAPDEASSRAREIKLVKWLSEIQDQAAAIVLVGDIFDFWYEYKKVVPRGFVRLLGKLAELSDAGIQIILFTGNHDLWLFKYLQEELNATVYTEPQVLEHNGIRILVGHGDGLGKGDYSYKFLKKVFTSPISIWAFARLHPNFGFGLAQSWSNKSREGIKPFDEKTDYLYNHCLAVQKDAHHDYYIFGHRHMPLTKDLSPHSTYVNLGEWVNNPHYAVFDSNKVELHRYT